MVVFNETEACLWSSKQTYLQTKINTSIFDLTPKNRIPRSDSKHLLIGISDASSRNDYTWIAKFDVADKTFR
uniref:Uncharacterized protein n=1 Tax=Onchocerca volvulus TaxID=6282 RepID=A0A8R1TYG0_ONCVO